MDPATARLFLALLPGPGVREGLLAARDRWSWASKASVVRAEQLHVTLHFIGEVARERLPEIEAGVEVPFDPFELRFGQPELWAHGLAVLTPRAIPERLLQLHRALRIALQDLALPTEARKYRPHVTFARRAAHAVPPEPGALLRWRVRSYALMESRHDSAGHYTTIKRYR